MLRPLRISLESPFEPDLRWGLTAPYYTYPSLIHPISPCSLNQWSLTPTPIYRTPPLSCQSEITYSTHTQLVCRNMKETAYVKPLGYYHSTHPHLVVNPPNNLVIVYLPVSSAGAIKGSIVPSPTRSCGCNPWDALEGKGAEQS